MKEQVKSIVRWIFIKLKIPVTKNIEYDILTDKILRHVLNDRSNCIDIGAHKGEILDLFLKYSPNGKHNAFEPIPYLYENLRNQYGSKVSVYPFALSTFHGVTEFNLVLDDPAYSGIKQRQYKTTSVKIDKIKVEVRTLDELMLESSPKIDLIKIDVEGGEFDVLKGAVEILKKHKPILVFECGKGASEFYGTKPEEIFVFLESFGYATSTLKAFSRNEGALLKEQFVELFERGDEYYFVGV